MRIDPTIYPRIFKLIQQRASELGQTCRLLPSNSTDPNATRFRFTSSENERVKVDCAEWMLPMEVGSVRYRTLYPANEVGEWLASSTIATDSVLYEAGFCSEGPCSEVRTTTMNSDSV